MILNHLLVGRRDGRLLVPPKEGLPESILVGLKYIFGTKLRSKKCVIMLYSNIIGKSLPDII